MKRTEQKGGRLRMHLMRKIAPSPITSCETHPSPLYYGEIMKTKFTLEYWRDDGWIVGRLREAPGVFSQGETLRELEENIRDAYELVRRDAAAPQKRTRSKTILIAS
jgi:predicted RNase H-like HicB family nuclease